MQIAGSGVIGVKKMMVRSGKLVGDRAMSFHRLLRTCIVTLAALAALMAGSALADPYRVMSGDTLKIDVFLSPEHSAETRVDDAGQITLPALGRIQAAGLTLEEVETAVVERLTRLSDISSVRVVASVTEYRPLFVLGLVNNPGRYPYSAHTTVLKALAVAGGVGNPFYRRSAQATNPTDLVDRQERFDVATLQYWSALARRARLLAEQKKAETIEFPPDLIAKLNAIGEQGVMDREREIFEARRQTLANSLSVIAQQKEVVQQEIASAESYAEEVKKAIPPMQKELENLTALRDKGLTRRLEVLTVQRQVSDMQRETRTSALSITRGQRELNDLEKQASNLKGQREAEVAQALVEVGTEINVLKARLDNQSKLLPAGSSITTPTAQNAGEGETPVTFEIVRLNADGLAITMPASEDTLLMPGDVLKVVTVAPAGAGSAVSN
jgi:protein involved in polysaccharide export with SLBB domain